MRTQMLDSSSSSPKFGRGRYLGQENEKSSCQIRNFVEEGFTLGDGRGKIFYIEMTLILSLLC